MLLPSINQLQQLPLERLQSIDESIDIFLFSETGGESWEESYKKDEKTFKKLLREMVSFKSDLMGYFRKQFESRYNLINQNVVKLDEYDDYLYAEQWYQNQKDLAAIIEKHVSRGFDIGVLAQALALGMAFDYGYQEQQRQILKRSELSAQTITETTRRRVKRAIQASMELKEDRTGFDSRLKSIFINPYRGRFIAQQEAVDAYIQGKEGLAVNQGLEYKRAESAQAKDKICGMVNGEIRKISEKFSNGFLRPRYHFGCRCNVAFAQSKEDF